MQMLIVQTLDGAQRVFDLFGEDVMIGREMVCDMQLAHDSVSREHAKLSWANGNYRISDEGSHNGTYVNGDLVDSSRPLKNGDVIRLGHFELIYLHGEVPRRFSKLDIPSMQRWFAVGVAVQDDATAQVSARLMSQLLDARRLLEGGAIVELTGELVELEDRRWVFGRGADFPVQGWLASSNEAELCWNGRSHVLKRNSWRAVRVNGRSIRSCMLDNGDVINIGGSQYAYEVQE
jgi:pSer/pThr/pTyr-binding forkhead associated (FHA) protein